MTDVYEHNPNDHEDPSAGPTWLIGFIGAVFMLVITFGLTAIYYTAQDEEVQTKYVEGRFPELEQLRAEQTARLAADRPDAVRLELRTEGDQEYQALVIPLERAMALTARELVTPPR